MTGRNSGGRGPDGWLPSSPWPPSSFLGSLADAERDNLLKLGTPRSYPRGRAILRQGESGDFVVLILRGIAKVSAVSETGKEVVLGIRGSGELVGEMAALSDQSRSASVVAATELRGREIASAPFIAYLGRAPGIASPLIQMVSDRLRAANRYRLEYNSSPVESRVARVLSSMARSFGHAEGNALRIGLEITQADLASLSSASLRTVEKVLRLFEQDGLIARKRRDLLVIDLAALEARVAAM